MKRTSLLVIATFALLAPGSVALLLYLKVPAPVDENCYWKDVEIRSVESPCCLDVVLFAKGSDTRYYINRGLERGIDPEAWNQALADQTVSLQVIQTRWNPLDPHRKLAPIAQVVRGEEIIFDAR
jgi:hypothetical protein